MTQSEESGGATASPGTPPSLGFGLAWMMALALTLCMLPVIGPFIAGVVGGRRIRRLTTALAAAVAPALFVGGSLYAMSRQGLHLNGRDVVYLPPGFALLQCAALVSGVLTGAGAGLSRIAGLAAFAAAIFLFQGEARSYWSALRTVQAAQAPPDEPVKKGCAENLRKLHSAIMHYADDWDDTLPPANRWLTLIRDQVPKDDLLRCPAVPAASGYGYAMNSELSARRWRQLKDHAATPLIFDSSEVGPDAHGDLSLLPHPGRHGGRNNVLYLDGHVEQK